MYFFACSWAILWSLWCCQCSPKMSGQQRRGYQIAYPDQKLAMFWLSSGAGAYLLSTSRPWFCTMAISLAELLAKNTSSHITSAWSRAVVPRAKIIPAAHVCFHRVKNWVGSHLLHDLEESARGMQLISRKCIRGERSILTWFLLQVTSSSLVRIRSLSCSLLKC